MTAVAPERHELIELDGTGDTRIEWDPTKEVEVEMARASFDKLKEKGYVAFHVTRMGNKGEQIREFAPEAKKILMVPQMVGG